MTKALALAAVLSVVCGAASAQPAPAPASTPAPTASPAPETPASPPPAAATPSGLTLAADTLVRIELADTVGSEGNHRGDKFAIRLAAPIVVNGETVAPAGATGQGEVVYAEPGGGGGKPGKLVLAARYIDVGTTRIKLKAFRLGAAGDDEFTQMAAAAALIGPAVMFMNGHNVVYPVGTRAAAKVSEDVVLPGQGAAPAAPAPAVSPTPAH